MPMLAGSRVVKGTIDLSEKQRVLQLLYADQISAEKFYSGIRGRGGISGICTKLSGLLVHQATLF
jgi:hypothetical protein